ncbi:MAG: CopG family transcriptional regulator [Acidobacteriota bacterium]
MTRMILSLEEQDKAWLERQAKSLNVSMAEVVRVAVRRMRDAEDKSMAEVLKATRGIWKNGDGLKYQQKLRSEW